MLDPSRRWPFGIVTPGPVSVRKPHSGLEGKTKKKKKESKQETASNSMEEKLEKDKQKKSEMTKWRKRKKLCFAIEKTNADKRAGLRGL